MAATRRTGAVKKAAAKKAAPKKAAPKKQPSPKQKAQRARSNREKVKQPPMLGAKAAEGEKLSDIVGEEAAKRILLLATMFDYQQELEIDRVKGAVIAMEHHIIPRFDNFYESLSGETKPPDSRGRPSLYDPSWMLVVTICLMGDGASKVELVAALGISEESLSQWCKADGEYYKPIFHAVIKLGERLSAGWWQRVGRKHLGDKEFSYTGWYMNMKNRFGWRDKHELTGDEEKPLQHNHAGEVTLTHHTDWDAVRERFDVVAKD